MTGIGLQIIFMLMKTSEQSEVLGDVAQNPQDKGNGLVGDEIRKLRKTRRLTLSDLGEKTGLSVGYLSQIERNMSSPTVKALFDISHVLGVNINWFFHDGNETSSGEEQYVIRSDRRKSIRYESGFTDQLLNTNAVKSFEFLYCTFEPQAATKKAEPYSHEGEECGIVISGQLQLHLDGVIYNLEEGDSFSFPSTLKHYYFNPGEKEARVIWCTSPPTY